MMEARAVTDKDDHALDRLLQEMEDLNKEVRYVAMCIVCDYAVVTRTPAVMRRRRSNIC